MFLKIELVVFGGGLLIGNENMIMDNSQIFGLIEQGMEAMLTDWGNAVEKVLLNKDRSLFGLLSWKSLLYIQGSAVHEC